MKSRSLELKDLFAKIWCPSRTPAVTPVKLKKLIAATWDLPDVFQLTQIAAQLARREDFEDIQKTEKAAEMAYALWNNSSQALRVALQQRIAQIEQDTNNFEEIEDREPSKLDLATFPMPYEEALEHIVKIKNIKDRHEKFCGFLRDLFRNHNSNLTPKELESQVGDFRVIFKRDGFSSDDFQMIDGWYQPWAKDLRRAKSKTANQAKLAKKNSEHETDGAGSLAELIESKRSPFEGKRRCKSNKHVFIYGDGGKVCQKCGYIENA